MLNLIIAIVSSAMVSITMRIGEKRCSGSMGLLAINYLICLIIAGCYMGLDQIFPKLDGLGLTMGMSCINGLLFMLGFVLLQLNIKRNGVVLSATFQKLGLLVPITISIFGFGERPVLTQILGFVIAVGAIVLINFEKEENAISFKLGLILLIFAGGMCDSMSKIFYEVANNALSEQFLFYTFVVAFLLCLAVIIYKKEKIGKNEIMFGALIGLPNYFSARFLLKSVEAIDAVIVYPTYSVGTILMVSIIGVLCFKEHLTGKQKIAIGFILLALVFLNI